MFNDTEEEISLKTKVRSPLIKLNTKVKKTSNLIQSPQVSTSFSSPIRTTPKRKAKTTTESPQISASNTPKKFASERSTRKHSYRESIDDDDESAAQVQNKKGRPLRKKQKLN